MVGDGGRYQDRHDGLLDLAGLVLIAAAALVCAVLALLGSSLAGQILPFLPGALLGDGLMYLAIRSPRYRKALVTSGVFLVAASSILSFNLWVGWGTGSPVGLPWEIPGLVEKLAAGVLLGFGGYVLSLVVVPALDAPKSWKEAVEQRRELVRVTLIVGGGLLVLVTLVALVFGALALVGYVVGNFSGPWAALASEPRLCRLLGEATRWRLAGPKIDGVPVAGSRQRRYGRRMTGTMHEGDFRELSGLLFGARERYRSARATILRTIDASVAGEANRRFVDWRFEQEGGPGMAVLGKGGPPARENFYREYEDAEEEFRLWHERPDRWREEGRNPEGKLVRCVAMAGRGHPLWIYEPPDTAIHVPSIPEERSPASFGFMLDPTEEMFRYSLIDDATVRKTGRSTTVAGREAVEVKVGTVSWGYPPMVFGDAPPGTTDHLLLVDAEVGTVLRAAARLENREFYVAEVVEIAYDEKFQQSTFSLELPA